MMDAPVAKTVMRRSVDFQDETKPAVAASRTAGPTVPLGPTVYIIAARKMKASATDFSLWLTPSAFITETVKRLAARVNTKRPAKGASPAQPVRGNWTICSRERINSTEASAATQPRSARVFQFPCGMVIIGPSRKANLVGRCFGLVRPGDF